MPTLKEINEAIEELSGAMIECTEAARAEDDIKLRKIKAQKRLSLARDLVREIRFNN